MITRDLPSEQVMLRAFGQAKPQANLDAAPLAFTHTAQGVCKSPFNTAEPVIRGPDPIQRDANIVESDIGNHVGGLIMNSCPVGRQRQHRHKVSGTFGNVEEIEPVQWFPTREDQGRDAKLAQILKEKKRFTPYVVESVKKTVLRKIGLG